MDRGTVRSTVATSMTGSDSPHRSNALRANAAGRCVVQATPPMKQRNGAPAGLCRHANRARGSGAVAGKHSHEGTARRSRCLKRGVFEWTNCSLR